MWSATQHQQQPTCQAGCEMQEEPHSAKVAKDELAEDVEVKQAAAGAKC